MAKQLTAAPNRPKVSSLVSDAGHLFRELLKTLGPSRPELHYMRGRGPKMARKQYWRQKTTSDL